MSKEERFELRVCSRNNNTKAKYLYDNTNNVVMSYDKRTIINLLNQQDAKIKELEKIRDKGNWKLENFYNEKIDELDNDYNNHLNELTNENQQLKQSQNQKAIEALEEIIEYIRNCETEPRYWDICQFISNHIKDLSIK